MQSRDDDSAGDKWWLRVSVLSGEIIYELRGTAAWTVKVRELVSIMKMELRKLWDGEFRLVFGTYELKDTDETALCNLIPQDADSLELTCIIQLDPRYTDHFLDWGMHVDRPAEVQKEIARLARLVQDPAYKARMP